MFPAVIFYGSSNYLKRFSLSALETTEMELSAIAAPANIGLRSGPPNA